MAPGIYVVPNDRLPGCWPKVVLGLFTTLVRKGDPGGVALTGLCGNRGEPALVRGVAAPLAAATCIMAVAGDGAIILAVLGPGNSVLTVSRGGGERLRMGRRVVALGVGVPLCGGVADKYFFVMLFSVVCMVVALFTAARPVVSASEGRLLTCEGESDGSWPTSRAV